MTEPKAAPQLEASGQSLLAGSDVHSAETSAQKPKAKKEKQSAVKVPVAAVPDSGAGLFARAQLQACCLSYCLRCYLHASLDGLVTVEQQQYMLPQVVRVLTVDDIASDKLYKTTIDIGGGQTRQVIVSLFPHADPSKKLSLSLSKVSGIDIGRLLYGKGTGSMQICTRGLFMQSSNGTGCYLQVVAGLKQHVEREALQGSLAVAILNLKAAKLAGEASEAMLLAADAPLEGGGELVRVLVPPGDCHVTQYAASTHCAHGFLCSNACCPRAPAHRPLALLGIR